VTELALQRDRPVREAYLDHQRDGAGGWSRELRRVVRPTMIVENHYISEVSSMAPSATQSQEK